MPTYLSPTLDFQCKNIALTVIKTAICLNPHADRPLVSRVGVEPDLKEEMLDETAKDWKKALLVFYRSEVGWNSDKR